MTVSQPSYTGERHLPVLDGLRGCAILLVLLLHLSTQIHQSRDPGALALRHVLGIGGTGVDLFFVLSGFLITSILYDAREAANYFSVFYVRRALRILPLYYAVLLLIFVVRPLLGGSSPGASPVSLRDQAWYWFYVQNFHPLPNGMFAQLWSLAIEEQFYLVWPLVVVALSRERALGVCAVAVAVSLVLRWVRIEAYHDYASAYFWTATRLDGLATGCAIALIARGKGGIATVRAHAWQIAIGAGVVDLLLLNGGSLDLGNVTGTTVTCILYGALLVLAIDRPPVALQSFLSSRGLRLFGKYSYALYVIHIALIAELARLGLTPARFAFAGSDLLGFVVYVVIVMIPLVVTAWLSWELWEKRFLSLKGHFVYRPRLPAAAVGPVSG